jgi:hypothetical protein
MRMEVHVQVSRPSDWQIRQAPKSRNDAESRRDVGHDFTLPRKASSEGEGASTVNRHR